MSGSHSIRKGVNTMLKVKKFVKKRADFAAMAFHLAIPSDTDRITLVDSFDSLMCAMRLRCKRKSAGDGSSSVIRRNIPSGRSNGESIFRHPLSHLAQGLKPRLLCAK